MSPWVSFYNDRVNNILYEDYFQKKYSIYLSEIKNRLPKVGGQVLEIGCGTSLTTKFLYRPGTAFTISDVSKNMLDLSAINLGNRFITKFQHDIRVPLIGKFDLIYSHGVLEHFSDEDLRKIIKNLSQATNKMVHYVPSNKYEQPSFGDERLLSKTQWFSLVQPTHIYSFNHGYDLLLLWE